MKGNVSQRHTSNDCSVFNLDVKISLDVGVTRYLTKDFLNQELAKEYLSYYKIHESVSKDKFSRDTL